MSHTFKSLLRFLANGTDVDAKTVNPILRDLDNNIKSVKEVVDDALLSQALFIRNVSCEEDLKLGQAAYYNAENQQYERALAAAGGDDLNSLTASSYPAGICVDKPNSTLCTLLTYGVSSVSLAEAVDGTITDGVYYLSGVEPGKLQLQVPAISVPVLHKMGDLILVKPSLADIFARHQHFKYDLLCLPSGEASLDTVWTIDTPDEDSEGWLPATDTYFDGVIPEGALFGYNIAASGLADVWPPIPASSASLIWDMGDGGGGREIITGEDRLVVIDRYGIWWMSNCEDTVPWPADYTLSTTTTTSTTVEPSCPFVEDMKMTLYFNKLAGKTDGAAVLSLQTDSDLLSITCVPTGEPAVTGHLNIGLDLDLALDPDLTAGYTALKGLSEEGKLLKGYMVEGLRSANSALLIGGGEALSEDTNPYRAGLLTLTAIINPLGAQLDIQNVQLDQVREEFPLDLMTLMFPADLESGFTADILLPEGVGVTAATIKLRFWIMGAEAGTLPTLELRGRIVERPADAEPVDVPTSADDFTISLVTGQTITANQYVEVTSGGVSLAPGDKLQFWLYRDASSNDGYNGAVHILKMTGVITAAE